MARRRMIDPHFWESADVAKLDIFARYVFVGMFSNADDEGRGMGGATYIRSMVFPHDDISLAKVKKALESISENLSVQFYSVDGAEYYQFTNWSKWQRVDKPRESLLPSPDDSKNDSREIPESFQSDSCLKEKKRKEEKEKIKEKDAHAREGDIFADRPFSQPVQDKLTEWLKYKAERRESYKPTGLKSFLTEVENKLKEHSESQIIALIGECMANNWQGIIWDKIKGRASPQQTNPFLRGKV